MDFWNLYEKVRTIDERVRSVGLVLLVIAVLWAFISYVRR